MKEKIKAENITDAELLDNIVQESFPYFLNEINPKNGLIADKNEPGSASSIAITGLGIGCYIVGIENGILSREEGINKVLTILRFFYSGHQGKEADAMGYKGFFYHFLDMKTGRRAFESELSTIDTAFFIAGVLAAANYFTKTTENETEIRLIAEKLYARIEWDWALNGTNTISHGWKPESGFLKPHWDCEYSEALALYILALGSPTFPIPPKGYKEWTSTFECKTAYDIEYIYAGPLFIHQLSHIWIDFRNIYDDANRKYGFDYFENSRRATYVHKAYAVENKNRFEGYGDDCWGLTASEGPGSVTIVIDGKERVFHDYIARGAPFGPDDGTVAPWASVASLPFAPEIVLEISRDTKHRLKENSPGTEGLVASYNPTYKDKSTGKMGWISPWLFGLNQGPIILMIENYRSGLVWTLMKKCPYIRNGLTKAGFKGGWLDDI